MKNFNEQKKTKIINLIDKLENYLNINPDWYIEKIIKETLSN